MLLVNSLIVGLLVVVNCEEVAHTPKTHCGIRNKNDVNLIQHNVTNETEFGKLPWMAALVHSIINKYYCAGTVITPKVIVTLASCVIGPAVDRVENIVVRVGEWDRDSVQDRLAYQERKIAKIIEHPNYQEGGRTSNNIVLIILEKELVRDEHVGTICLPTVAMEFTSKKDCYAMGWGYSNYTDTPNRILKRVKMSMLNSTECDNAISSKIGFFKLHPSSTCARPGEKTDICQGDSGGSLVCPDPNNSDRYLLVGIASLSTINCDLTVFSKISYFRDWMDQQLRKEKLDNNAYII